jgi:MFS-type transporter involved in bile tolerance (Atg22 family)
MSVVMMAVAPQTPKFVSRFGANRVAGTGLLAVAVGLLIFSLSGTDTDYWQVLLTFVVLAVGFSLTMSPMTTQMMSSVPRSKAGVGSAMNDTTRELGGALGVAVLGSLVTSRYASSLASVLGDVAAPVREIARSGLSGAVALADTPEQFPGLRLPAGVGEGIKAAAQQAFVDGLGVAALVGAAVVAVASVVVFRYLPSDRANAEVVGPARAADPSLVGVGAD